MATETPTFSPPASVTIPGEIALEALALLDAYAEVMGGFALDGEPDPFFNIEEPVFESLRVALGEPPRGDLDGPQWEAMKVRSSQLAREIRSHFNGPALGAIVVMKMANDIDELRVRMGLESHA
jgi:hypothetical protein